MGKGEQHYIWPSQCKYANMPFSNVYLRGSAADKMFSIPNISEFGPIGGRGVGILKKGGTYSCHQGSHQKKKLRNFGHCPKLRDPLGWYGRKKYGRLGSAQTPRPLTEVWTF